LEVELKLEIDPADMDTLAACTLLGLGGRPKERFDSIYFDTLENGLHEAGFSLRIRREQNRRIQTLKATRAAAAGLFVRPEWANEIHGEEPRIELLAPVLGPLISEDVLERLKPAFRVLVSRTSAIIERGPARIEIVADRGDVIDGGRTLPVCEIELELKKGDPAALFALAREINDLVPARLSVLSKAERGYRLINRTAELPAKSDPIPLGPDVTTSSAFQVIALACLRQYRLNEDLLMQTRCPEAVHQARVGLRRLRSAIAMFRPMLSGDPRLDGFRAELGWLTRALNPVRNLDVLLPKLEDPAVSEVMRHARDEAFARVREDLCSPRARNLMLDLAEWLAVGTWLINPIDKSFAEQPVSEAAAVILDRYFTRLEKQGRHLAQFDCDRLHRLRMTGKKLRYAAGFFQSLYTERRTARRCASLIRDSGRLQDHLGTINDRLIAPSLLAERGISGQMVGGLAVGARERKKLARHVRRDLDQVLKHRGFWR
jgi:inorganic triphosphatase YgiF